jgi:hypothetical protein
MGIQNGEIMLVNWSVKPKEDGALYGNTGWTKEIKGYF